jgi:hypothetical protein
MPIMEPTLNTASMAKMDRKPSIIDFGFLVIFVMKRKLKEKVNMLYPMISAMFPTKLVVNTGCIS